MNRNAFWIVVIIIGAIVGAGVGRSLASSMSGGSAMLLALVAIAFVVGLIIWSLSGNKVGRRADPAAEADARAMTPAPGKARIYIVRRGFVGALAGMKVGIDGIATGQLKSGQFVMAEVAPGNYRIETAMARGQRGSQAETQLVVAEGEAVVIHVTLEMGALSGKTIQSRLDPGRGRGEIAGAKLVQWTGQG